MDLKSSPEPRTQEPSPKRQRLSSNEKSTDLTTDVDIDIDEKEMAQTFSELQAEISLLKRENKRLRRQLDTIHKLAVVIE